MATIFETKNLQLFRFYLTKNRVVKRKGLEVINAWSIPSGNQFYTQKYMVLCRKGLNLFVSYASPQVVLLKWVAILEAAEHQLFLDKKPKYTQQGIS